MMTARQLIAKLIKLKDQDKEVLVNIDGSFMSIESVDACDEEHPGYLIWLEDLFTSIPNKKSESLPLNISVENYFDHYNPMED